MSHFLLIEVNFYKNIFLILTFNLTGIPTRTYSIIPSTFLLRSNLNGEWKLSIEERPSRKLSFNFASETIRVSNEPLTRSLK